MAQLDPPTPTSLDPTLPAGLDYVCARALSKPVDSRYPDGATFAEDLEDVLAGQPPRHQPGWTPALVTGGGTIVALAPPAAPAPGGSPRPPVAADKAATPAPQPRSRVRPRAGLSLLAVSLLVLAGVLSTSSFWRRLLAPADETERARVLSMLVSVADEAGERFRDAARRLAGGARPPTAAGDEGHQVRSGPGSHSSFPGCDVSLVGPTLAAAIRAARLSVSVTHSGADAALTLWVDEVPLCRGTLPRGPNPQPLVFRLAEGGYRGVLSIEPGEHTLRARVVTSTSALDGHVTGSFAAGQSRHLDVHVDPDRLLLNWRGWPSGESAGGPPIRPQ